MNNYPEYESGELHYRFGTVSPSLKAAGEGYGHVEEVDPCTTFLNAHI